MSWIKIVKYIKFDHDPDFWPNLDPDSRFMLTVKSLKGEFLSSILHLLTLIYPVITCMDQYSVYGSIKVAEYGSNLDLDPQHCFQGTGNGILLKVTGSMLCYWQLCLMLAGLPL